MATMIERHGVLDGQRLRILTARPARQPLDSRWRAFQFKWSTE
jgi:hypothetical protein